MKLSKEELKEVFAEVGSEENLYSLLLRFYEVMSKDVLIGYFFEGKDLAKIAENQKNFLMRSWGLMASYHGKPPVQAHEKLPAILSGHFDRRLTLLRQILKEHGLSSRSTELWIAFETSFRKQIVERRTAPTKEKEK